MGPVFCFEYLEVHREALSLADQFLDPGIEGGDITSEVLGLVVELGVAVDRRGKADTRGGQFAVDVVEAEAGSVDLGGHVEELARGLLALRLERGHALD